MISLKALNGINTDFYRSAFPVEFFFNSTDIYICNILQHILTGNIYQIFWSTFFQIVNIEYEQNIFFLQCMFK